MKIEKIQVGDHRFIRIGSSPDGEIFGTFGEPLIFVLKEENQKSIYYFPAIGINIVYNRDVGAEHIREKSEEDFIKFFNTALNLHNIKSKKIMHGNRERYFWETLDDLSEEILPYLEGMSLSKLDLKLIILRMHKSLASISDKIMKIGSSEVPGNVLDLGEKFEEAIMMMLKDLK